MIGVVIVVAPFGIGSVEAAPRQLASCAHIEDDVPGVLDIAADSNLVRRWTLKLFAFTIANARAIRVFRASAPDRIRSR